MNIELPRVTKNNELGALDDKWYDRFKEGASFQDYEYLTGEKTYRGAQKDSFLKGEIKNPKLDYPELKKFDFTDKEQALLALKKDILENENNEVVRHAYRWKINEKIAELRMLRATKNSNDKKFLHYSKFIYGNPSLEIFYFNLRQLKDVVDSGLASPYLNIRLAAERIFKEVLADIPKELYETVSLNKVAAPSLSLARSVNAKSYKKYYDDEAIKSAFEGALEIFETEGFKVLIDSTGKNKGISVSQEKKTITIPKGRKTEESYLKRLLVHEIGTHAQRRSRGELSRLKLLGLGLDHFLKGEEGLATYGEQLLTESAGYAGFDGHLAISLARGMDGKERDFRQVFEILKDYFFIKSKQSPEKALKSAEDSAWNRCVRTFRGTTCQTPGACFTRDITYREGNIGIWSVVKDNPEEVRRFSVGKYDPANPRHIWILDQLGITETDLAMLDKENQL